MAPLAENRPAAAERWSVVDGIEAGRVALHNQPFRVVHPLADSPLFEIESLLPVAREARKRADDLYFDAGNVSVDDKWGNIPVPDLPVEQVINRIRSANAWIIMKHVEKDPRYAAVLNEFYDFVRKVAGPELSRDFSNPEMLVIISSPKRLTSFHFDAEVNFLIQVQGTKEVWICDPHDRSIVSDQDIEDYYGKTNTAGKYRPEFEAKATRFLVRPGEGVHIPTHAAHWVRNGEDVSVSLSLNLELPSSRYKDVCIANSRLRRLGLRPTLPGVNPVLDKAKATATRTMRGLRETLRL